MVNNRAWLILQEAELESKQLITLLYAVGNSSGGGYSLKMTTAWLSESSEKAFIW